MLIGLILLLFGLFQSRFKRAEMGRRVTKKFLRTGNGTVFRGSVQHLRVVFSRLGGTVRARAEFGLSENRIEILTRESNRAGQVEWELA